MPTRILLLAAMTLFTAAGCSPRPDESISETGVSSSAEAEGAIDSVMVRYIAAVEGGDAETIGGILTEDAEIVFPTGPMRKGRADVVAAFDEMFASMTIVQLRPTDAQRMFSGDMAVETGAFTITLQPKGPDDAPEITDRGYYLLVWERQDDGSWKMARGFNRSDAPPAGAATVQAAGA